MEREFKADLSDRLNKLLSDAKLAGIDQVHCCVMRHGELIYSSDEHEQCFDIASLSKILSTVTLAAHGLSMGLFGLESTVSSLLADSPSEWNGITIGHLLSHSSGMVPWLPFFAAAMEPEDRPDIFSNPDLMAHVDRSKSRVWEAIKASPLGGAAGLERRYSDTGFIVLGRAIELAFSTSHSGCDLSSLFEMYVAEKIGLNNTAYRPMPQQGDPQIAPTGLVRPRPPANGQEGLYPLADSDDTPETPGMVDDDNAYALGGVAGHAGLFSTAHDVAKYGDWVSTLILSSDNTPLAMSLRSLCIEDTGPSGPKRTHGFDLPTPPNSSVGEKFGDGHRGAIGHLGFTGCSLWIDLDREVSVSLLSNRVFPERGNAAEILELRRAVHTAIAAEFPPQLSGD